MNEVTFRTRKAARLWAQRFQESIGDGTLVTVRGELNATLFTRTKKVWILEVPASQAEHAAQFFPAAVINQ